MTKPADRRYVSFFLALAPQTSRQPELAQRQAESKPKIDYTAAHPPTPEARLKTRALFFRRAEWEANWRHFGLFAKYSAASARIRCGGGAKRASRTNQLVGRGAKWTRSLISVFDFNTSPKQAGPIHPHLLRRRHRRHEITLTGPSKSTWSHHAWKTRALRRPFSAPRCLAPRCAATDEYKGQKSVRTPASTHHKTYFQHYFRPQRFGLRFPPAGFAPGGPSLPAASAYESRIQNDSNCITAPPLLLRWVATLKNAVKKAARRNGTPSGALLLILSKGPFIRTPLPRRFYRKMRFLVVFFFPPFRPASRLTQSSRSMRQFVGWPSRPTRAPARMNGRGPNTIPGCAPG